MKMDNKQIKRIIAIFLIIIFAVPSCTKSSSTSNGPRVRQATQELLDEFKPIAPLELQPLELVEIPERDAPPENSTFYRLKLGEIAPIDGFLFSDSAAAFITTEYQALSQRFQLTLETQRDRDLARLNLETGLLRLNINSDREKFLLIVRTMDIDIQDLQNIIKEQSSPFPKLFTIISVGISGVALGFILAIIIN